MCSHVLFQNIYWTVLTGFKNTSVLISYRKNITVVRVMSKQSPFYTVIARDLREDSGKEAFTVVLILLEKNRFLTD